MLRIALACLALAGCVGDPTALRAEREACFDHYEFACDYVREFDIKAFGRQSMCEFRWC